jgi:hypothetical protein
MSASSVDTISLLSSQYRCPEEYGNFEVSGRASAAPGFFAFGRGLACFGRTSSGHLSRSPGGVLHDTLREIASDAECIRLPFDPNEIIENLRLERYMHTHDSTRFEAIQKIYYTFRPLMSVGFRKHLQRLYLKRWRQIAFPAWPVDRTVENIFERLLSLKITSRQEPIPFVWFWPQGHSGCVMLTHDIETARGRDHCVELAAMDASFGMKSAFQVVPENSYEVKLSFLESLRAKGAEINLHGLTHDGQLFRDRNRFLRDVKHINSYARQYGARGFRSPVMYRNLEWYGDLDLAYDMSVPNAAHLDPQRGGCCTVMPYFIGNILELPLTTVQDYSLFNILGERSIDLWKRQIELILEKHGLLSFNIHPDYIMNEPFRGLYRELLQHLRQVCAERNIWIALPGEVDQWWRQRQRMSVACNEHPFQIVGPQSDRAALAFARVVNGRITYEIEARKLAMPSMAKAAVRITCHEVA